MTKKAIIIGAGPAGLTAAYELLTKTDIQPVIFEATAEIGGISKTYNYNGNRMDMGGHRFFSKSDEVMNWWLNILPLQGYPSKDDRVLGTKKVFSGLEDAPDPERTDRVMLVRNRLSRIFYRRTFFDYPVSLNKNTILNLGFWRIFKSGISYIKSRITPIKPEKSLEDFLINRFGKELYNTFFRDYTEKVWGVSPAFIKPDWGTQRIKGLSISKVLLHALKNLISLKSRKGDISREKSKETSLIEQFLYPKYGPGQLWEEVARLIKEKGGEILLNHKVVGLSGADYKINKIVAQDVTNNDIKEFEADFVISSMPVKDLINAFKDSVPEQVKVIADGLVYRDFITVGLLLKKLSISNKTKNNTFNDMVPDLWIYVQEPDVKIGRLQVFNNWSPYLVKDWENTVWIGLEYFATEGDELWRMPEDEFKDFAIKELVKLKIIDSSDIIDSCIMKVPKAYPAYFGTYDSFTEIRSFVDKYANLFLIGRNGMHRYNNMDHSMLTAMKTVAIIRSGEKDKGQIWEINSEEEYHEQRYTKLENEQQSISVST